MNRINSSLNKKTNNKKVKKDKKIKEVKENKKGKKVKDITDNKKVKETENPKEFKKAKKYKEPKRKKHPILKFIRNIFILLILLIILFGFLFYKKVEQNGGGAKGVLCTILGQSVEDLQNLKPINVLVLGVSEDIEKELTDTIILCNYNPQTQSATMLSIPRDTFIGKNQDTAKGSDKINSLYSKDISKTVNSVSKLTDVDIDYYAVVKTSSLTKIVDIIGGINFEVPIDMDYDDPTQDLHIHLSKGMQKIDGDKAEQLLRFRHNNDYTSYPAEYGDNDYGRMRTQREFMQETLKQTLTLKNLKDAKEIIDCIFENIETNLTKEDCIPYIPIAVDFDINSIQSIQLPGESKKCNNLWFFIHDKKETKKIIEELFK